MYKINITQKEYNKWLEALESGDYKQGEGVYHNTSTGCYCVVGVFLEVMNIEPMHQNGHWVTKVMGDQLFEKLIEMNDDNNYSFPDLGIWIRAHVKPTL